MIDKEKILKGLECCSAMSGHECRKCPYSDECIGVEIPYGMGHLAGNAFELIQAYHQLVEWAVDCGFGFDNIPDIYEQYKNDVDRMGYTDGLIYLASKFMEDGGMTNDRNQIRERFSS